jgi:hypothetical protein
MTEFEQSLVALGISAATAFSLPKSVGALFLIIIPVGPGRDARTALCSLGLPFSGKLNT